MAILHVTTAEAWVSIQKDGEISPGETRGTTGPDRDKVSAFIVDADLLKNPGFLTGLRDFFVESRNPRRSLHDLPLLSPSDIVILQIADGFDAGWVESPKEEFLDKDLPGMESILKTNWYVKTFRSIPVEVVSIVP